MHALVVGSGDGERHVTITVHSDVTGLVSDILRKWSPCKKCLSKDLSGRFNDIFKSHSWSLRHDKDIPNDVFGNWQGQSQKDSNLCRRGPAGRGWSN